MRLDVGRRGSARIGAGQPSSSSAKMLARTKTAQWAPCTLGARGGFGQHVSGPVDDTAPTRRTPQHALGGGDHPAAPPLMTSDGGRVPRPGPVLGGHRVHRGERASQEQVVQRTSSRRCSLRALSRVLIAPQTREPVDLLSAACAPSASPRVASTSWTDRPRTNAALTNDFARGRAQASARRRPSRGSCPQTRTPTRG